MTDSIPCTLFKGKPQRRKKRDEVRVDPLSVELCLGCTLPVEECYGALAATGSGYHGPPRCPYEAAVMERKAAKTRVVTLPGPRPDGVMREWECEVEI